MEAVNKVKVNTPKVVVKKTFFVFFVFGIGLGIGWLSKSLISAQPFQPQDVGDISITTPTPTPTPKCDPFNQKHQHLLVEVPEDKYDTIYFRRPSRHLCYPTNSSVNIFFKKGQNYRFPSFLSEYSFFMVNNYAGDSHGFYWTHNVFSKAYHGQPTSRETENFEVMIYPQSPDGIWASAGLKEDYPQVDPTLKLKTNASVFLHAENAEDIEDMLKDIDNIKISDYYKTSISETTIEDFLWHVPDPNYLDRSKLYRYFLPAGYFWYEEEGYTQQIRFENVGEGHICLALYGAGSEPCNFSTSGCTCCNTGCALVDIALFADIYGEPIVESVLVKGDSESGWIRFIYNSQVSRNPWISYSASFWSDEFKYKSGIRNFLNLVSSIERIYP